jgi:DNA-directed RNA polymerase specialized sigma24 family protein
LSFNPSPDDYARALADELERLSRKDFYQLYGYVRARLFAVLLYLPEYAPEDLVQEALVRTIDGRRAWNREKTFKAHLKSAMDSIASDLLKKYSKRPDWKDWNAYQQLLEDTESEMYARYRLDRLRQRLAKDTLAATVLQSRLDGVNPAETCKMLGLEDKDYNAARRRIVRAWEMINRDE